MLAHQCAAPVLGQIIALGVYDMEKWLDKLFPGHPQGGRGMKQTMRRSLTIWTCLQKWQIFYFWPVFCLVVCMLDNNFQLLCYFQQIYQVKEQRRISKLACLVLVLGTFAWRIWVYTIIFLSRQKIFILLFVVLLYWATIQILIRFINVN